MLHLILSRTISELEILVLCLLDKTSHVYPSPSKVSSIYSYYNILSTLKDLEYV